MFNVCLQHSYHEPCRTNELVVVRIRMRENIYKAYLGTKSKGSTPHEEEGLVNLGGIRRFLIRFQG